VFGAHVWRRDPPCARRHNKEYLLKSLPTTESSTPASHSINGKEKEEEKELSKPTKSKAIILVMAIMSQVTFFNFFLPRN